MLDLHAGQARAWDSRARFIFVLAGTQSGKTTFGAWWLANEIKRRGAGDYLAVTSSYDLFKLKMLPSLRETFEHVLGIGRYWRGDRIIEIADPERGFWAKRAGEPMYARIILRSAQADGGLESATASAAWLDEVGQDTFTLEHWEAVLRRLSLAEGRVLATTTIYNVGWLKTEVYDKWEQGDKDIEVIQFPSYANPSFPFAEYERARRTMPNWRFQMFYAGLFARPVGLIYADFDDAVQVVDDFILPSAMPRYVGIDFGGANVARVWLAHDEIADVFYLYRELLDGGKSTRELVNDTRALSRDENVVAYYGGAASESQQRRDWSAEGLDVLKPPVGDVEAGIDRVTALVKPRPPRFKVFRSCRGVLDELGTYRRKLDKRGMPSDEIESKRFFHRLDALRYAACGVAENATQSFVYNYLETQRRK